MSRKVFTAGEVLAAADVNSFLMDQTVMSFAGTAARGSAIGTATEGMYTHLEDTDRLEFWNGSAWVSPFGTTLVSSVSPSAVSTIALNNIFTSQYDNYRILFNLTRSTTASITLQLTSGGTPATTNYSRLLMDGNQSLGFAIVYDNALSAWVIQAAATPRVPGTLDLFSPALPQDTSGYYLSQFGSGTGQMSFNLASLRHVATTSYDGLLFSCSAGTISGTVQVYGMRK